MAHTDPHAHGGHAHGHGAASPAAVGHETSDADLGGVERFIAIMAAFLASCFILVAILVWYFNGRQAAIDVKPSPMVARPGDRLPPVPRLQVDPPQDLAGFRRSENEILNGWAWVDKDKTVAEIPVSRAIDILAEHGLPVPSVTVAPTPPSATAAPAAAPADAGAEPRRPGN
jgi:hypothetical protein